MSNNTISDEQSKSNEQSKTDRSKNVVTNDEPLGEQVPGAPFAVVALTYVVLLAAASLFIALVYWLIGPS